MVILQQLFHLLWSLSIVCFSHYTDSHFDVVGWYVGDNASEFSMYDIRWDLYTDVRFGTISVNQTTGVASCNRSNPLYDVAEHLALANGTRLTLHSEVDVEQCSFFNTTSSYCSAYFDTLPDAVHECGPAVGGIEFDYEWGLHTNILGYIRRGFVRKFSTFLDKHQRRLGDNYTVSCDVSVYLLPFTRWVDADIFQNNSNLFVNSMSYHWPHHCGIEDWEYDAWVIHNEWGIPRSQINIGVGYFTMNQSTTGHIYNRPIWRDSYWRCPNITMSDCTCDGLRLVSPDMNYNIGKFVGEHQFRGVFPWAADYDNKYNPLVRYLTDGLTAARASPESV